jgi:hypothetical protein
MTQFRTWLASVGVIALLFGLDFPNPQLTGEPAPLPNDHTMVMAEGSSSDQRQAQSEENADQQTGAQSGDESASPSETKKVDQPPGAHPGNEN